MRLLALQKISEHNRSKRLNFFRRSDCLRGRRWRLVFYHVVRREPASLAGLNSCSLPPTTTNELNKKIHFFARVTHQPPSSRLVSTIRSPFLKHSSSLLEPLKGNSACIIVLSIASASSRMDPENTATVRTMRIYEADLWGDENELFQSAGQTRNKLAHREVRFLLRNATGGSREGRKLVQTNNSLVTHLNKL